MGHVNLRGSSKKRKLHISVRKGFLGKGYDITWGYPGVGTIGVEHRKTKRSAKVLQAVLLSQHRGYSKKA